MVKVVIGTKICSFEELIEEYSRVCEENEELRKQISELESELSVKEDLLKIKNAFCEGEALPFSDEQYEEDLIGELEDRHQQDCITINQLHVTIDTLVDRYAKLREVKGL